MLMQNLAGKQDVKWEMYKGRIASLTFYVVSPAGKEWGTRWREEGEGGGGVLVGCYLIKFYTGRIRPKIQPLTLHKPFLTEKVPLWSTFY